MNNKIFLIGFMGSGKTTVGKLLSHKMGFEFCDTDDIIVQNEKKSIAEIFKTEGESVFRELEENVIRQLEENKDDLVIATGGGLPCFNDLMDEINESGTTIYLKCNEEVIFDRLKNDTDKRPLLEKGSLTATYQFIRQKLNARAGTYESAHIIVDGNGKPEKVVAEILKKLKLQVE